MRMAGKERDIWQYGDFQTPRALAEEVCAVLARRSLIARAVVEPTCGKGSFLAAALKQFPQAHPILGVDINPAYIEAAHDTLGNSAQLHVSDFFTTNWNRLLGQETGPWLVLGNPPWVTNAELGLLKSDNLPVKSNFQGHKGLDAITGKANFDISEWMLMAQLEWLRERSGWIAMLVKTSVARKVLRHAWRRADPVGRASIYKIDAMRHFGAAVDACLFVLPVCIGTPSQDCDVFVDLQATEPQSTIGFHDGLLVSDVHAYLQHRDLLGADPHYVWRSGVKHDCSKVMELAESQGGALLNGLGEHADLEKTNLFPLLKSSDVSKGRTRTDRFMIVPQREIGEETAGLADTAPRTWRYLLRHADRLDARGSLIYKRKPRFSVFGVGPYTFASWKVAISGFYKTLNFMKVGPVDGRPVVMDDTIYFLACRSEAEADFVIGLVTSPPFTRLLEAMVFSDEKRPITADLLKRVSLELVAEQMGLADEYSAFTGPQKPLQRRLALG